MRSLTIANIVLNQNALEGIGRDLFAAAPRKGLEALLGEQLIAARGAFLERFLAVALEHQGRGAPYVDFGYHRPRLSPNREAYQVLGLLLLTTAHRGQRGLARFAPTVSAAS